MCVWHPGVCGRDRLRHALPSAAQPGTPSPQHPAHVCDDFASPPALLHLEPALLRGPRLIGPSRLGAQPDPVLPAALHLFQRRESFPEQHQRLSLGCPVLDRFLGGGLPLEGITGLAGRSSAGKTQLALQLCLTVQFPRQYGGLEAGEWLLLPEG